MSAVVGDVAGEVLGPRPGKAACSFSKGIGEMILRTGAAVSHDFSVIVHTYYIDILRYWEYFLL